MSTVDGPLERVSFGHVLSKVKRGESLMKALKRELYEEIGLHAQIGSLLGVLDRRDKDAITLLFAAVPKKRSIKVHQDS